MPSSAKLSLASILLARGSCGVGAEAILEAPGHGLQVLHAASAWCTAAFCLGSPVIGSDLCGWVATACACLLLVVEGSLAASHAKAVSLGMPLTHAWCTVTHL